MNRIVIIGCGGAGKTFLSNLLSKKTGLPVYHLDLISYEDNWKEVEHEILKKRHTDLIKKDKWIIDGMLLQQLPDRLTRSDLVIFLDYAPWRNIYGALKRLIVDYGKIRPDTPKGCTESFDFHFLLYLLSFHKNVRPKLHKILENPDNKCSIMIFKNRNETQKWLDSYEPH